VNYTEVEVHDYYCAAWLHVNGVRIEHISVDRAGKASFLFLNDDLVARCIAEWRTLRAMVDARAYAESLRLTKRLMMTAVHAAQQPKITGESNNDSAVQPTPTPR
jgi:hypothetical protein